jgi:seryl-tRNA synthetase
VQSREANIKFELTQLQDKHDKATQKLEATRGKAAQDHTEFSLKIQQLEENIREKTEEADESIIVLYADNERLEQQIQELTQKSKLLQLGQLQSLRQSFLITSSADLNQAATNSPSDSGQTLGVEGIQTPLDIDRKIVDLEEQVLLITKKLRASEDKEVTLNKKVGAQKDRFSHLRLRSINAPKEL